MEQLRIIKEMRERDRRNGRTDEHIRPRYMVWENVPGAFSSNKGEDFRTVLEETAKVIDKDAVIPMPEKNKWHTSGCILGDGWSIAWRVLDAQFWGVPQRRRRITLVADFGGESASEILFIRKSVSRDTDESATERKRTSSDPQGSIGVYDSNGVAYTMQERAGCSGGGKGALIQTDKSASLRCGNWQTLFQPITYSKSKRAQTPTDYETWKESDKANTMNCFDQGDVRATDVVVYSLENHPQDSRVQIDDSGKVQTLTGRMGTGGGNVPMVMTEREVIAFDRSAYNQGINAKFDIGIDENGIAHSLVAKGPGGVCYLDTSHADDVVRVDDVVAPLQARDYKGGKMICAVDCRNGTEDDINGALQSNSAHSLNGNNVVRVRYIVRRLTPLECERLQGFPDGWTDIGEYIDQNGKKKKSSDAARYKALGNSIALPPWRWVLKRISACYERTPTMASLFDGIGGFPKTWEDLNGKGTCIWSSEIDDFPDAVTKVRLG
jgi:DNA (cytosine-5)-methyltransferase 1